MVDLQDWAWDWTTVQHMRMKVSEILIFNKKGGPMEVGGIFIIRRLNARLLFECDDIGRRR